MSAYGFWGASVRAALRSASRAYPFLSGCARLASTRPYRWASRESGLVQTRLKDGSAILVHLDDYVGRAAYYFGDLDPKISWICRRLLREGDVALDVGGNYGVVAMQLARLVGPSGSVHVFEPQRELVDLISASAALNGYENICVHPIGLSNQDASVWLTVSDDNRGMGTVSRNIPGRQQLVELRAGSAYLEKLGLKRPRFVKIDVEGHESEVILGASSWIRQVQPEVILFEHNEPGRPLYEVPAVSTLVEEGYELFGLAKSRLRMKVAHLGRELAHTQSFHDILAIHPDSAWLPPCNGVRRTELTRKAMTRSSSPAQGSDAVLLRD